MLQASQYFMRVSSQAGELLRYKLVMRPNYQFWLIIGSYCSNYCAQNIPLPLNNQPLCLLGCWLQVYGLLWRQRYLWAGVLLAHCCAIFFCYLGCVDDHHRNSNGNVRDHLPGHLHLFSCIYPNKTPLLSQTLGYKQHQQSIFSNIYSQHIMPLISGFI